MQTETIINDAIFTSRLYGDKNTSIFICICYIESQLWIESFEILDISGISEKEAVVRLKVLARSPQYF